MGSIGAEPPCDGLGTTFFTGKTDGLLSIYETRPVLSLNSIEFEPFIEGVKNWSFVTQQALRITDH